jgi:very-short-patch-repair endonuclease
MRGPLRESEPRGNAPSPSRVLVFHSAVSPSPRARGEERKRAARGHPAMRGAKVVKTQRARRLRRDSTDAELKLWYQLRSRSITGFKFVRQEPIGLYIVDFACRERRLIVELDGGQHAESKSDVVRDQWLADHGYRVLRFWNNDVMANTDGVLPTIATALSAEI